MQWIIVFQAVFSIPIARFILSPFASQACRWRRGIDWSQGLTAIPMLAATALSRLSKVQN
jgi:hypothetical protein